jgi:hypothetical protein
MNPLNDPTNTESWLPSAAELNESALSNNPPAPTAGEFNGLDNHELDTPEF